MGGELDEVITALTDLKEDSAVPKNVKLKIDNTIKILNEDSDQSLKVDRALQELDDIADDSNVQAFTRTQIWNIVSLLEKIA